MSKLFTWLLNFLPDSWIEGIARKWAGVVLTKLCTIVATLAAAHGATSLKNSDWITLTADTGVTLLVGWLSTYLSNMRHWQKTADINHASIGSPVGLKLPPPIVAGGGVGMSATNVNP